MFDRNHIQLSYRYGFNGKEKDPEGLGGGGSTYDYGFRIYNAQLGKFLSVDPLYQSYAALTPYQFSSNMPIASIDIDGLEAKLAIYGAGVDKSHTENHQALFKIEAEKDVTWKNADHAISCMTGKRLVAELEGATKDKGSINYLSIFSHCTNTHILLDNGQFGNHNVGNKYWSSKWTMVELGDEIFNNSKIKFDPDALIVIGGCNAGGNNTTNEFEFSIAEYITDEFDVATIGAVGYTAPDANGVRKADISYYLNYKDENGDLRKLDLGKELTVATIEKAKAVLAAVQEKICLAQEAADAKAASQQEQKQSSSSDSTSAPKETKAGNEPGRTSSHGAPKKKT